MVGTQYGFQFKLKVFDVIYSKYVFTETFTGRRQQGLCRSSFKNLCIQISTGLKLLWTGVYNIKYLDNELIIKGYLTKISD